MFLMNARYCEEVRVACELVCCSGGEIEMKGCIVVVERR